MKKRVIAGAIALMLAVGTCVPLVGCKSPVEDQAVRQRVIAAASEIKDAYFQLEGDMECTVLAEKDSIRQTTEIDIDMDGGFSVKNGQVSADIFTEAESEIRTKLNGVESKYITETYSLLFMRGDKIYAAAGKWSDYGVETGNFSELLSRKKGDYVAFQGGSVSLSEQLQATAGMPVDFGDSVVFLLGDLYEKNSGYELVYDSVQGAKKLVSIVETIADEMIQNPQITLLELLEIDKIENKVKPIINGVPADYLRTALTESNSNKESAFPVEDGCTAWEYLLECLRSDEVARAVKNNPNATALGNMPASDALETTGAEIKEQTDEFNKSPETYILKRVTGLGGIKKNSVKFKNSIIVNFDEAMNLQSYRVIEDLRATVNESGEEIKIEADADIEIRRGIARPLTSLAGYRATDGRELFGTLDPPEPFSARLTFWGLYNPDWRKHENVVFDVAFAVENDVVTVTVSNQSMGLSESCTVDYKAEGALERTVEKELFSESDTEVMLDGRPFVVKGGVKLIMTADKGADYYHVQVTLNGHNYFVESRDIIKVLQ